MKINVRITAQNKTNRFNNLEFLVHPLLCLHWIHQIKNQIFCFFHCVVSYRNYVLEFNFVKTILWIYDWNSFYELRSIYCIENITFFIVNLVWILIYECGKNRMLLKMLLHCFLWFDNHLIEEYGNSVNWFYQPQLFTVWKSANSAIRFSYCK